MTITAVQENDLEYLCHATAETARNPVAAVSGTGHIVRYVNPAFCRLTGMSKDQLIGKAIADIVPGGEKSVSLLDRVYSSGIADVHTGSEGTAEHPLYWSFSMSPVLGADDLPIGILFRVTEWTSFDQDTIAINQALLLSSLRQHELTEKAVKLNEQLQAEIFVSQKAQESLVQKELHIQAAVKEKNILLGEIHHRVKNNLQIVNSLLDLQCSQIEDPVAVAMLRDSQSRIRSMALIHQTLYQSNDFGRVDFGMFLNTMVPTLVNSYLRDPERIALTIDCENMHLPINAAIPCGLLVNELICNALKHAFPAERQGRIAIKFAREQGEQVALSVSDDGVGIPEDLNLRETTSLGLQLTFLLTEQLRGTMTVNRHDPTSFVLRFTIDHTPAASSA